MSVCHAPGCISNRNTKVNGRNIVFFPFPAEESILRKWEKNSKLKHSTEEERKRLNLCEKHFEKSNFSAENKLKSDAVPTIFEFSKKRKVDDDSKPGGNPVEGSGSKRIKLEPNTHNTLTSSQSSSAQVKLENEPDGTNSNTVPTEKPQSEFNGHSKGSSVFTNQVEMGNKVYRLIIQIDKISSRPPLVPKKPVTPSKPEDRTVKATSNTPESLVNESLLSETTKHMQCTKMGCKLMKTTLNSKPVFQCERCHKYYIVKQNNFEENSNKSCSICNESFPNDQSLNLHTRKHFTCGMCQVECHNQSTFDKHTRLHVSTDSLRPYKCHICALDFEMKDDLQAHYQNAHSRISAEGTVHETQEVKREENAAPQFQCEFCYITFKKERAYKNHLNVHATNRGFNCIVCDKTFQTSKQLITHRASHVGMLKFTCKVCTRGFDDVEAVDEHMKTHMEMVKQEHKCNICKKLFKSEVLLSEHVRGHLSRAQRCPICPKAFINKTTLTIHLKTHTQATSEHSDDTEDVTMENNKTYSCTLCTDVFDNYSKMYNHIMSHLERMHAEDGGAAMDSIEGILESEEDILS